MPEMYAPVPAISDEERNWLMKLQGEIWKRSEPDRFKSVHLSLYRSLSSSEWNKVRKLIGSYQLPCEMRSGAYGGLYIRVYAHPLSMGMEAEFLLSMEQDHLPDIQDRRNRTVSWKIFSGFTHNIRNKELLELYGLEPSREYSHYSY